MWPIMTVSAVLALWSMFLLVRQRSAMLVKLLLVPVILCMSLWAPWFFLGLIGVPYPETLPDRFWYVAHLTRVENTHKTRLEIWTVIDGRSRLYVVPYDSQLESQLEGARDAAGQGVDVIISRTQDPNDSSDWQVDIHTPTSQYTK
jgi:hypothetical protein